MAAVCPILGRPTEVEPIDVSREPWQLLRCRETGFVFIANPPDYARLAEEFAWEKTCRTETARRVQAEPWVAKWSALTRFVRRAVLPNRNRLFAMARAVLPRGTSLTLLDVGCGTGSLLADIARRYARLGIAVVPLGIEISRHLAAVSGAAYAALGGKVVFAGAVDGMSEFPPESLDGIFLSSFLEHEAQPLRLLRETRRALKTAGAIVLKVPNYACWNRLLRGRRWCGYRFPDHVNYFTPRTLAILATEAGFVVARQNFLDRLPLSDSMYAVLRKKA